MNTGAPGYGILRSDKIGGSVVVITGLPDNPAFSAPFAVLMHSLGNIDLSLDGQTGLDLSDGDRVRCRKSEHQVKLFRTGSDFFQVLRSKLKWGEKPS